MKNDNDKYEDSIYVPLSGSVIIRPNYKAIWRELQKNNYMQRLIISLMDVLHEYNYTLWEEYNRSILDDDQLPCKDALDLIEEITGENVRDKFK